MMSRWGWFARVDVALIGALGYAALLGCALWGLQPPWHHRRAPAITLLCLTVPAVLFTVRLKYAEWVILQTFCIWWLESAVTITLCLVLAVLDWRRLRAGPRAG